MVVELDYPSPYMLLNSCDASLSDVDVLHGFATVILVLNGLVFLKLPEP